MAAVAVKMQRHRRPLEDRSMVRVTRLNGSEIWLNPVLIESLEATPDCVLKMSNGHIYVVRETPEQVQSLVTNFYQGVSLIPAMIHEGDKG